MWVSVLLSFWAVWRQGGLCSLHLVYGSLAVPLTALRGSSRLETDGVAKLPLSPGFAVCWVRAVSFNRDKALRMALKTSICSRPFVTWV